MIWLGWLEVLLLSMLAAGLSMGITALATVNRRPDTETVTGVSVTLGAMGSALALAVCALVIAGVAGAAWPKAFGYLGAAGGAAGIAGCVLTRRRRKAAGILMLVAGLLSFISLAGPALLMTGGALAAGRSQALSGKRAAVKSLRIVMSMVFLVLILIPMFFRISLIYLAIIAVVFLAYLATMIMDYVMSLTGKRKAAANRPA